MSLRLDPKVGDVTTAMRLWCYRMVEGARLYRTREYSYTTYCDRFRTPSYGVVEKMRDNGLIVFVPGRTEGIVWEAQLTELGREIGSRPPTYEMLRRSMPDRERDGG